MTTQTLDHHAVLDLYEKGIQDEPRIRIITDDPAPGWTMPEINQPMDSTIVLALRYMSKLMALDSDQRKDYVLDANPAVTEEHLGHLVVTTTNWLRSDAHERLMAVACEVVQQQRDPREVLLNWLTDDELDRFYHALDQTEFPDHTLAVCYALCKADDMARASHFIQHNRAFPTVDLSNITQTSEDIADDLRAFNLR